MNRWDVREGMTVRTMDGEKLGKIIRCGENDFLIEKGLFFRKDYIAGYDEIDSIDGDVIKLRATTDAIRAGTTADLGETGGTWIGEKERLGASGQARIPVVEEELDVTKRRKETGAVRVTKDVTTETKSIDVPVVKESVRVERVPATGEWRGNEAKLEGGEVTIPVREEEVEITKRPVVKEEVLVSKEARTGSEHFEEEVRREDVDIDRSGASLRRDDDATYHP